MVPKLEGSVKPGDVLIQMIQEQGIDVPADKVAELDKHMNRAKYGHQVELLLTCKGEKCPIINSCPLKKVGIEFPMGEKCPYEAALMSDWISSYIVSLDIKSDQDESAIDMFMVHELAGNELLKMRAAHKLGNEGELSQEKVVGYSPQGQPIYDDKPSQSLLILERQGRSANKLRNELLATRKAQAQVGHVSNDVTTKANALRLTAIAATNERREKAIQNENTIDVPNEKES